MSELRDRPDDALSRRLPLVIDTIVFVMAGVAGVMGDVGQRTPLQVLAVLLWIASFYALGFLGRRSDSSTAVGFAMADVGLIVVLAALHTPAGALALLIVGSSFRVGTQVMLGEWRMFVLVDVAVLVIVLVRTTSGDIASRAWAMEVAAFFAVALVFVQAAVAYANVARRAYAALAQAHAELREQVDRVGEIAALRERERVALDIHDAIGHELTVLTMQLESAAHALGTHPAAADLTRAHAGSLRVLANVRRSVQQINAQPRT